MTTKTLVRPHAAGLRTATLGATLALVGFILLPSFRLIVGAILGDEDVVYPTPQTAADQTWWGLVGGAVLCLIGTGVILLATALADASAPARRFAAAIGVTGGVAYALSGAGARAMYSLATANLSETGADAGAQTAAMWAINIATSAPLYLGIVATGGWLVCVAAGATAANLGRPLRATLGIAGGLVAVAAFGIEILAVQFLFVPVFAALGIALWRRGRRAEQTALDV